MKSKIHHNTAKKAKVHGITLVVDEFDGSIVASKDGQRLASHLSGSVALDMAIAKLNGKAPSRALLDKAAGNATSAKRTRKSRDEDEEVDEESEDEGEDVEDDVDEEADEESEDEGEDVEDDVDEEADEDKSEGASIVKRKYKKAYRPFHHKCGDDLAERITQHVSAENADGEVRVDPKKLRRFAQANDCWVPSYASLNIGQQRMNVGNRLRAKIKKGHKVVWG